MMVCFFLVTCGPPTTSAFIITAGGYIPHEVPRVTVYLMFSSSVVNPIIYEIMNTPFKTCFTTEHSQGFSISVLIEQFSLKCICRSTFQPLASAEEIKTYSE